MKELRYIIAFILLSAVCTAQQPTAKQHRYMQRTYKSVKSAVDEAEVSLLKDTVKILFPDYLLFHVNSATITPDNYPLIKRLAISLNKHHKTSILVNGHTDIAGEDTYNLQLSKRRADSAKAVLVMYDVAPERIFTWGMGSKQPIADNNT